MDPLKCLPTEVWTSIIMEVAGDYLLHFIEGWVISQDVLLDLSHVSNYWEVLISSNTVLWTDIILEDEYDAAVKAAIALHYSQTAPLTLYLSHTSWWNVLREDIIRNKGRIKSLHMNSDLESIIYPIIKELVPLDNLESIIYETMDQEEESRIQRESILFCLSASPIKQVQGLLLGSFTLRQLRIRQPRSIQLNEDIVVVVDILEGFQYLRELEVIIEPINAVKHTATHSTRITEVLPDPLRLQTLEYYASGEVQSLLPIIGRLVNLVFLRIDIDQKAFVSLIPLIGGLGKLASIAMNLVGAWTTFSLTSVLQISYTVRELDIFSSITDIPENQRIEANQRLANVIFQCFPEVRQLQLAAHGRSIMPLSAHIDGFKHVNCLSVSDYRQSKDFYSKEAAKPLPQSVERLIYILHSIYLVSFPFYSPSIKHLGIETYSPADVDMYNPAWPALHSLSVNCCVTLTWKGPAFRHLWYISLGSSFLGEEKNSTKLCQQIATHPNYFPVLRKLRLEVCPEWDILLILLENRLDTTYHGTSRISTLEIPSRCPPFLVEYFKDIIKGNRVKRIDYYSISVASAYEIVQDVSIPGCAECHRALRFCSMPPIVMTGVVPFEPLKYPESTAEILQSWEIRAEKWYPAAELLRVRHCNRSFPLVSLSE